MFKKIKESQVSITQLMLPSNSNFSGKIHGGFILGLMDQIAFACASKHCGHYCVTASVNKVDFLNPIEVGELVTLKASVNYTGTTSMVVGVRVESENIQTAVKKHCNSSYFTMVAKDENGNNATVPGIILDTKNSIRRFSRSIVRKEQSKKRINAFKSSEFKMDTYLELLKTQNALLKFSEKSKN
ncbi:MAG: acyl-CoA thioesterase [Flavobacteriaceae bacterium]|nr:acyl-CoA thioesterase [Bacteroidia bacterium]NNL16958.1 acyl-CoA thioesterase [Flavobacteriaceae bacterium]